MWTPQVSPFSYNTGTSILTVSLTNTSPAGTGFLTAFVFNNPSDLITNVAFTDDAVFTAFDLIGGPSFQNSIDAQPFGNFDIGASSTSGA